MLEEPGNKTTGKWDVTHETRHWAPASPNSSADWRGPGMTGWRLIMILQRTSRAGEERTAEEGGFI